MSFLTPLHKWTMCLSSLWVISLLPPLFTCSVSVLSGASCLSMKASCCLCLISWASGWPFWSLEEHSGPVLLVHSFIPAHISRDPYKQTHEESKLALCNFRAATLLFVLLLGSWTSSFHGAQRPCWTFTSLISSALFVNITSRTSLMYDHPDQMFLKVVICAPEAWISCALMHFPWRKY